MPEKLEFFYDYVSPYSYLANHEIGRFENADVVYRPLFLGAVMKATGNRPPATVAAKRDYLQEDLRRWGAAYGIPFKFNSVFPQKTVNALRLAIAAQRRGVFERVHQPLFDAMFVADRDLGDDRVLADIVSEVGLDADEMMAAIADQSIKDALRRNTEEAIERGAFGAPTMFVGDEMFFGNDRLSFVRAALEEMR